MLSVTDLQGKRNQIEATILTLRNRANELRDELKATEIAEQQAMGALLLLNELLQGPATPEAPEGNANGDLLCRDDGQQQ